MRGKLIAGTPRIFISHATPDTEFAEQLASDLRRAGADVWLDATHLAGTGGDFIARISAALDSRDVLILILSKAAIESKWVPDEMNVSIARHKDGAMRPPIIVVKEPVETKRIPGMWIIYNRIDASGTKYEQALPNVYRMLEMRAPAPPIPLTAKPSNIDPSTLVPATPIQVDPAVSQPRHSLEQRRETAPKTSSTMDGFLSFLLETNWLKLTWQTCLGILIYGLMIGLAIAVVLEIIFAIHNQVHP